MPSYLEAVHSLHVYNRSYMVIIWYFVLWRLFSARIFTTPHLGHCMTYLSAVFNQSLTFMYFVPKWNMLSQLCDSSWDAYQQWPACWIGRHYLTVNDLQCDMDSAVTQWPIQWLSILILIIIQDFLWLQMFTTVGVHCSVVVKVR